MPGARCRSGGVAVAIGAGLVCCSATLARQTWRGEIERHHAEAFAAPARDSIVVKGVSGKVVVRGDANATELTAEVLVTVRASTEYGANFAINRCAPSMTVVGDVVTFALSDDGASEAPLAFSHWVVTVPVATNIRIEASESDVEVTDIRGDVTIDRSDDVTVARVDGNVSVDSSRDVSITDVTGNVEVDAARDAAISGAQGDVDARSAMGDVVVATRGSIKVNASFGDAYVTQLGVASPVDIETGFGDIELTVPREGWTQLVALAGRGRVIGPDPLPQAIAWVVGNDRLVADIAQTPGPTIRLESGWGNIVLSFAQ